MDKIIAEIEKLKEDALASYGRSADEDGANYWCGFQSALRRVIRILEASSTEELVQGAHKMSKPDSRDVDISYVGITFWWRKYQHIKQMLEDFKLKGESVEETIARLLTREKTNPNGPQTGLDGREIPEGER